jgi:hypothetical protein
MSFSLSVRSVAVIHPFTRIVRDVSAVIATALPARLKQIRRHRHEHCVAAGIMAAGHTGVIADFERASRAR